MVMSVKEQILSLEEQLANIKGPYSAKRKADIQQQINELKKNDEPEESDNAFSRAQNKVIDTAVDSDIPAGWVVVTQKQVEDFEREGRLFGFDPDRMIALIK